MSTTANSDESGGAKNGGENDEEFDLSTMYEDVSPNELEPTDVMMNAWLDAFDVLEIESSWDGEKSVEISYDELQLVDEQLAGEYPSLLDLVVMSPLEGLVNGTAALRQLLQTNDVCVRPVGESPTHKRLEDIRTSDVNTLISVDARVTDSSEIKPTVVLSVFKCMSCGTRQKIEQKYRTSSKLIYPYECTHEECGCSAPRNFQFLAERSSWVDGREIIVQDLHETSDKDNPSEMVAILHKDLCGQVDPGDHVRLNCIVKTYEGDDKFAQPFLRVVGLEHDEEDYESIDISDEEKEKIRNIGSRPDVFDTLVSGVAPNIEGDDYYAAKMAILMQLATSGRIPTRDGDMRGSSHMLFLGEPGTGKSQLMKFARGIEGKSEWATGEGISGVGLLAALDREDRFSSTDKWTIRAGTLVRANRGLACIDELDKASDSELNQLYTALESQVAKIDKAVSAELPAVTRVLATSNPKHDVWRDDEPLDSQLKFPKAILDRFDLIFRFEDRQDDDRDREIAGSIFSQVAEADMEDEDKDYPSKDFLRKYLAYCRRYNPSIPTDIVDQAEDMYVEMRGTNEDDDPDSPLGAKPRQAEGLLRLSLASARLRLSETVEEEDLERARWLIDSSMRQTATDENGDIDASIWVNGRSQSQAERMKTAEETVDILTEEGSEPVSREALIASLVDDGISQDKAQRSIKKLCDRGYIYEHKDGLYRKA
ncbi:ATP-dependent DNA helicase MCM [Natrialba magadii ATCC 43099]|uniref:ATP-dependent DNA helicase MCM n=1 Tax=Natrialba magadii (strain ATCC 43099 / DSM 3394 / CCM 3739 / CIP 104546 / IAM 13178 / JCM 8861 / NBRC 102185 / NCIMB 2190 / MS3) TaxID=547559 RepID=D3SX09_NATMM|nr:minichromosome maintenance protein MCM [Natrialba magadii]ADD03829.1 ATP-dependent DNA helicase MCM [Natrialba magadii ATCC 43099]ELY33492.1 MCM family protein [Natrialba magadii ATCC 43099]